MLSLGLLSLLLPTILGEQLLTFQDPSLSRNIRACLDSSILTCNKVSVNVDALLNAEKLDLPENLVLTLSRVAQAGTKDSLALTFDNQDEDVQAVFVQSLHGDKTLVSGSLNWAKSGRHFKLETCSTEDANEDCYTWAEVNPMKWGNEVTAQLHDEVDRKVSEEQKRLLAVGMEDTTTQANVTVTVYLSESFRSYFNDDTAQMKTFVDLAIAESNQGYVNSGVAITMSLKCMINSDVEDNTDIHVMLDDFLAAAKAAKNFSTFRKTADIALLLSASDLSACGVAYTNILETGQTLGVVKRSCATGYYSFAHEIGHMYGASHNREQGSTNKAWPSAYGYLIRPPTSSGYRTILAYTAKGYSTRVNYYSSSNVTYKDMPTGDANNDNAKLLSDRRFVMAAVGDDSSSTC